MASSNAANPQAGQGRPLPKKEGDLFKNLVKHYELKQYKKAIKQADQILKKFPSHGETLCMKGLTINCTGKREEAHQFVKLGLRNDMRSHVCWHVYGLLHRSDRNYAEAIKAYKQALRIDADNLQILRDLSLLQMQLRDLQGFLVTRHSILTLKPTQKLHWLTFMLAKRLIGDTDGALQVVDIYLSQLDKDAPDWERAFEPSELQLYKNDLIALTGDYSKALAHLEECRRMVVDRGAWLWRQAKYYLLQEEFQKAQQTYLQLLQRGATEDYRIHAGYQCAVLEWNHVDLDVSPFKGTDTIVSLYELIDDERNLLLDMYRNDLKDQFQKSAAVIKMPFWLLLSKPKEQGAAMRSYCWSQVRKGVPSLARELSSFLLVKKDSDNKMYRRVNDALEVRNHELFQYLCTMSDEFISQASENDEAPVTIFWAWFLRASLHELAAEYSQGLALLDKCLEHTPTAVDVYEVKARLIRGAGDINAAVECLDTGRDLDQQDRYINNLTTKFMLYANRHDTALERISLFTKHEGNPEQNLQDMQCSWYELDVADCHFRMQDYGKSLKKYAAVMKHFDDIHEDQFDFHSYCVRKVTLRAYTKVLKWEDDLWGQPYYRRAAEGTIRIYLHVFDNPLLVAEDAEPDYASMTAAERKKQKAIARKKKKAAEKKVEQAKKEEEEAAAAAAAAADTANGDKKKKPAAAEVVVDEDPDGKELLKRDALDECKKYSAILSKHASSYLSTWLLQYDVSMRRGKILMAMQALFKAHALDPLASELLIRLVDFGTKVSTTAMPTNDVVKDVVQSELPTLLHEKSLADYIAFRAASVDKSTPLPTRVAIAKAMVKQSSQTAEAVKLILNGGVEGREVSTETCREAFAALQELGDDKACSQWKEMVKTRLPMLQDLSSTPSAVCQ